jgi:hypothetical protein
MKLQCATTVVVALVVIAGSAACQTLPPPSTGRIFVAGRDLHELVRASELVAIGTVVSTGGTRVTSRDPNDLTREDPNYVAIAQDYAFAVEAAIKGAASGTITVTIATSSRVKNAWFWSEVQQRRVLPNVGSRYALFLRTLPWDASVYVLGFEPSQFELDTTASVRSTWRDASTYFPDRDLSEFLRALRDAAAGEAP